MERVSRTKTQKQGEGGFRLHMRLTGIPPANASERLVARIAGDHKRVPLPWLEEKISAALYHAELARGASAVDLGLSGPALFRTEATRLLREIRPEFALLLSNRD